MKEYSTLRFHTSRVNIYLDIFDIFLEILLWSASEMGVA